MTDLTDPEAVRRFVEAVSPAAGLTLDEDEVSAVTIQVQIIAGLAAQLPKELDDDLEPAPRYEP